MKRTYDMTPRELMDAIEKAEANGDTQLAKELQESLDLLYRVAESFRASNWKPIDGEG